MVDIWHIFDETTRLRTCTRQDTIYVETHLPIWLVCIGSLNCKGYRIPLTWFNLQRSIFIITIKLVPIGIPTFNNSCVIKNGHGEVFIYFGITRNWEEVVKTWSRCIWLKLHMNSRILKFFKLAELLLHINSLPVWRIGFNIFFLYNSIGIFQLSGIKITRNVSNFFFVFTLCSWIFVWCFCFCWFFRPWVCLQLFTAHFSSLIRCCWQFVCEFLIEIRQISCLYFLRQFWQRLPRCFTIRWWRLLSQSRSSTKNNRSNHYWSCSNCKFPNSVSLFSIKMSLIHILPLIF